MDSSSAPSAERGSRSPVRDSLEPPPVTGHSEKGPSWEDDVSSSNPLGLVPISPQSATNSASETDEEFLRNKSRDPELVRGPPEPQHGASFENESGQPPMAEESQLPSALELPHPWREAFASKKAVFGVCQRAPNLLKAVEMAMPTSSRAFRSFFRQRGSSGHGQPGNAKGDSTGQQMDDKASGERKTSGVAAADTLFPAVRSDSDDDQDAPQEDWLHAAASPEHTASLVVFLREDEGVLGKCCRQKQRTDCRLGRETLLFHELQLATKKVPLDSPGTGGSRSSGTPTAGITPTTSPSTTNTSSSLTPTESSSSAATPHSQPPSPYFMLQLEIDPSVLLSQLLHFPTHLTAHQCAYYCGLSHFRDRNRPTEFLLLMCAAVDSAATDLLLPILRLLISSFRRLLHAAAPWVPFFLFLSAAKAFERLGSLRMSVRWHWLLHRIFHHQTAHAPVEAAAQVLHVALESMLHLSQLLGLITAAADAKGATPVAAPEFGAPSFDLHDLAACHRQLAADVARAALTHAESGETVSPITFSTAEMSECRFHLERVRADLASFCTNPAGTNDDRGVLTLRADHPIVKSCVAVIRLCKVELSLRLQWETETRRQADRTATNLVVQDYCDRGPRLSRQCVKEWLKADRDRLEQLRRCLAGAGSVGA